MLRHLNAWLLYPLAERLQGRQIRAKLRALDSELKLPWTERALLRRRQLAAALARAGEYVPYYRDLFKKLNFDPGKLAADAAYLGDLPYLTKDLIREHGARLLSEKFNAADLHLRKTGGSTGASTMIYYSGEALDWTAAANALSQSWCGKGRSQRETHLASRFPDKFPWRDRLKERMKCAALNRGNIFTDDFDDASLERAWNRLRRARPYLLQGHPSTLYALASYLLRRGIDARGVLRVFESTGELLDQKKRYVIERVFGCETLDRYGNAEFGVLAHECLGSVDERLRLIDAIAWPETLAHESGTPELVFTGLLNDAMPLVRYRSGDLGNLTLDADGFWIAGIVGRTHEIVRIGGHDYPTHYLQDVLDRIGGIDEFQFEPRPAGRPILRLVVPHQPVQAAVRQHLQRFWGDAVEIEFTDFSGLVRRGWRGKFSYVVPQCQAA